MGKNILTCDQVIPKKLLDIHGVWLFSNKHITIKCPCGLFFFYSLNRPFLSSPPLLAYCASFAARFEKAQGERKVLTSNLMWRVALLLQ